MGQPESPEFTSQTLPVTVLIHGEMKGKRKGGMTCIPSWSCVWESKRMAWLQREKRIDRVSAEPAPEDSPPGAGSAPSSGGTHGFFLDGFSISLT